MTRTLTALALLPLLAAASAAADRPVVKIWPDGPPGGLGAVSAERAEELNKQNVPDRVFMVDDPSLTLYLVESAEPRAAVVVCPGGGYNILAWEKEGTEVAEWLNSLGISAAVLRYRVPRRDPDQPHAAPMQDAQRAIRLMRHNAEKWRVDPKRIGLLGFSAGGNLTMMTGLHPTRRTYDPVDEADKLSARPDLLIPIYPAYLGRDDDPYRLNDQIVVTKETPPTFIAVTFDDKHRAVHSALLLVELQRHGVPSELHIYSKGGHGYGLRPSADPVSYWPHLCADWLAVQGWVAEASGASEGAER